MDKKFELKYHDVEESHWWFQGRRDMVFALIAKEDRNSAVLDLGCSGGALIQHLQKKGFSRIWGLDVSEEAINLCKQKDLQNVFLMSGEKPEFANMKFDIVIASDVLEHIKDDRQALMAWYDLVKPEGRLIVFVPAFQFLWSAHDEVNHHYRRYSKSGLVDMAQKAGFKVERVSYWNTFLFLPIVLMRIIKKKFSKKGEKEGNLTETSVFVNQPLTFLLKFENWLLQAMDFPLESVFLPYCERANKKSSDQAHTLIFQASKLNRFIGLESSRGAFIIFLPFWALQGILSAS